MGVKQRLLEKAAAMNKRVVFPEGGDARVIEAAHQLAERKLARPVLIAEPENVLRMRGGSRRGETKLEILSPQRDADRFAQRLLALRAHKGLRESDAAVLARDPLYRGALMVRDGEADACVAGAVRTTSETVRAALQCIGAAGGTVSSFFLMIFEKEDRCLLYADCGVIPFPTATQLADIAISSAESWRALTDLDPVTALLSFSTHGSAHDPSIDVILEALKLVRERAPELAVDGDLQADAALVADVAKRKCPGSPVAGKANVFIFPNLHAGNIAYKLTERLAGAIAVGPILQGLSHPMNDLSRGCSVEDIVLAAAISAIQCGPE